MALLVFFFAMFSGFLVVDFLRFLISGKRILAGVIKFVIELFSIVTSPLIYLSLLDPAINDCCTESATFSPEHKLTIYFLIALFVAMYFISSYLHKMQSPIVETFINVCLVGGVIFNIFIGIHVEGFFFLLGNLPIIILFLFQLHDNHIKFMEFSEGQESTSASKLEQLAWKVLKADLLVKIPILTLLLIPIMAIISSMLLLFGQKPDSIIRAFTDTYRHGLSELDYLCENVQCGGHFLCSVAASGHRKVVSPVRLGERGGAKIMCNRQLLVANAFEELIQEKMPRAHRLIRKNYNKVGDVVHKYYGIFNLKIVSDLVYVLMKPLEYIFLFTLYIFDQKPENRIAKQYLSRQDRKTLEDLNV